MKQFSNREYAKIHSTGSNLDGQLVRVIVLAVDQYPVFCMYIIQKPNNQPFPNGWDTIVMPDSCLDY
jgi:hypothetical protein